MPRRVRFAKGTKYTPKKSKVIASAKTIALNALRKVNRINRDADKKYIDYELGTDTPGTTATLQFITPLQQGNSDITRIGDTISPKSVCINGEVWAHAGVNFDIMRVMLIQDRENRGALPSATDILAVGDTRSHRNLVYSKRFKVLRDRHFTLDPSGMTVKSWKWYVPLFKAMKYGSNNGDVTDARENSLFVLYVAKDNTANKSTISFKSRVIYTDA